MNKALQTLVLVAERLGGPGFAQKLLQVLVCCGDMDRGDRPPTQSQGRWIAFCCAAVLAPAALQGLTSGGLCFWSQAILYRSQGTTPADLQALTTRQNRLITEPWVPASSVISRW